MNEQPIPVLVVGAGPTGLTMAIELARHGVAVRIIDREPQPPITSRALVVQPRTLEIFDDMGVIDEAISAGNPSTAVTVTFRKKNKKVLFDIAGLLTGLLNYTAYPEHRT